MLRMPRANDTGDQRDERLALRRNYKQALRIHAEHIRTEAANRLED